MPFPIPKDTAEVINSGRQECRNWGLLFQRYIEYRDGWVLDKDKLAALKYIVDRANEAKRGNDRRSADYREIIGRHHLRWQLTVKAAGALDGCIFEADPEWRFVIGLGQESALETGFTFHHVYGFPYLPGSALKGLTQTYALWLVAEHFGVPGIPPGHKVESETPIQLLESLLLTPEDEDEERRRILDRLRSNRLLPDQSKLKALSADEAIRELQKHEAESPYRVVFGTQKARGRVVFFDAVPVEPPRLVVDVMNPHYGPYYQEKGKRTPPADYHSPVPVYFLAVESGSRFAFAVAAKEVSLARLACGWLKEALGMMGAGGKTSAGYGYFSSIGSTLAQPGPPQTAPSPVTPPIVSPPTTDQRPVVGKSAKGKVRYEQGRPYIIDQDDPSKKIRVDWKQMGMNALADRTLVHYEYHEEPDGRRHLLKVVKTPG